MTENSVRIMGHLSLFFFFSKECVMNEGRHCIQVQFKLQKNTCNYAELKHQDDYSDAKAHYLGVYEYIQELRRLVSQGFQC